MIEISILGGASYGSPHLTNRAAAPALPVMRFFCLMALAVMAEFGIPFLQAAASEDSTNANRAYPATQFAPSQGQPTNQASFSSAAEAEAQALAVSAWMEMARSKREQPQVQMRIHEAGATAQGGAHRLDLDGNLHVQHAVRIIMADQQEMEGHVVSLAVSDASGQRIWLGHVKDCVGEQIPGTTQVIYRDAFDSIKADVIVGYSLNSVEQFVVFRERFELPAEIDPATARLEAWTEWFQAPEPRKKEQPITLRQGKNQGDIVDVDEELDFGVMRMTEGKAFMTLGDSTQKDISATGSIDAANNAVEAPILVSKRWIEGQHRRFLVESVDFKTIKSLLDQLPARQSSMKPRSTNPQALPALTPIQSSRTAMLAQLSNPQSAIRNSQSLWDSPGVVLDYELVYSALLNIQFGNSVARKAGGAAVYRTTNDFWNWYVYPGQWSASMSNLLWSHEIASTISMTVVNAPGQWGNQTGDPMFDAYIYNYYMGQPIVVGFSGVPAGSYDLYVYGHGAADNQDGKYQVNAGGTNSIVQQTAVTNCWNQSIGTNWVQGIHYVRYTNLVVGADGVLTVNVQLDTAGYPIINGLQLVAAPVNNSTYVAQSIPTSMIAGQSYSISVTMHNSGTTTWNAAQTYRLGSQNPQDNQTWGLFRVSLTNDVPTGADVTFNFTVVAPSTPGTYNCQWRMVEDWVEWFGASTPNVAVTVTNATLTSGDASIVLAQSIPTSMIAGQSNNISVTMYNAGTNTWSEAQSYRLGSQNAQDNQTWGLSRVSLPNDVPSRSSVTFNFTVVAPSTPGTYNCQWRMVHDGVASFGAFTPNVPVAVGSDADGDGLPDYPLLKVTIAQPRNGTILP